MVKVSVIMPVYNGAEYLETCLDSVLGQTLKDIEIICVDDGSTDNSYEILEAYKRKDNRIQVYRQQNKYAGVARNLGKSKATGEYMIFWDCDDFYELNALEELSKLMDKVQADICVCGADHYYTDVEASYPVPRIVAKKKIPEGETFNIVTNEKYILNFTNDAPWNKMYRRAFVEETGLDFQAVRNGNDVYFTACAMCLAEKITTTQKVYVHYRKNQKNSLVGTVSKSPTSVFEAWIAVAETLKKQDRYPEQSLINKFLESMIYTLKNIRHRDGFYAAVRFLKEEAFSKLNIHEFDEEYYYTAWHKEMLPKLIHDSAEDFRDYLMSQTYGQAIFSNAKFQKANQEIKRLKKKIKKQEKMIQELQDKQLKVRFKKICKKTFLYRIYKRLKGRGKA